KRDPQWPVRGRVGGWTAGVSVDACRARPADRLDFDRKAPCGGKADRLGMDQGAGEPEGVVIIHGGELAGMKDERRIAFEDAVHILVEPHGLGLELAAEDSSGEVRAAPSEQGPLTLFAEADEA